jgi:hypothetical protein
MMADLPGYMRSCLHTGKLAFLAILVSGGVVLQILVSVALSFCDKVYLLFSYLVCLMLQACALYDNWWPMLTGKWLKFLVLDFSIGLVTKGLCVLVVPLWCFLINLRFQIWVLFVCVCERERERAVTYQVMLRADMLKPKLVMLIMFCRIQ